MHKMRTLLFVGWMGGCDSLHPPEQRPIPFQSTPEQRLIQVMDRNNDGVLDRAEIKQITGGHLDIATMDEDGNEQIDATEVQRTLKMMSPLWRAWPDPLEPLKEQERMRYDKK